MRKEIAPGIFISYSENPKLIDEAKELEELQDEQHERQQPTPIAAKVAYVVRQSQSRYHTCHFPDCKTQVPPAMFMCAPHWGKIPRKLQRKIWHTYEIGQEIDMSPSEEYLAVVDEVQKYIEEHLL